MKLKTTAPPTFTQLQNDHCATQGRKDIDFLGANTKEQHSEVGERDVEDEEEHLTFKHEQSLETAKGLRAGVERGPVRARLQTGGGSFKGGVRTHSL